MKINTPFEISDECKSRLLVIEQFPSDIFSEIVKAAGMQKECDFIGADLAEVNFTGSDLRGFNFKNADLSHSYGVNVLIDETTNLAGANVNGSVFRYEKDRREFLMDDAHRDLFNRLKGEYWTNGAIWIGQNLNPSSKNYAVSSKIAKFLFSSVTDQTYKNQILYGIKNTFESREEYKAFLVDQLRNPNLSTRTLRGIIDIFGRIFSRDVDIIRLLLFYLGHPESEIRRLCIPAVMQKGFFQRNRDRILALVRLETSSELRRLYSGYFGALVAENAWRALYDESKKQFIDFREPIDNRLFERLVASAVRAEKVARKTDAAFRGDNSLGTDVSYQDIVQNAGRYNDIIMEIMKEGLPLEIEYQIEKYAALAPMGDASATIR